MIFELAKTVLANAKGNPVASALALVALALLGAGHKMTELHIEPWGTAVSGLGAAIVIGLGFAVPKLLPKKEEPPQ